MMRFLVAASMLIAAPATAAITPIDLSGVTNGDWAGQSFNTIPTGNVTLGGTPFLIHTVEPGASARYWTAAGGGNPETLTVPVSIFGAHTGYTLINQFWGAAGQGLQSVTFNATGGLSATFVLVGNDDVRDYLNNVYTNNINNTTTVQVFTEGARRLDRQTFALPGSFASQTLTSVVFTDTGSDGVSRLTLTALSIGSVPEPSSWAMLIAGFGLVGAAMRRRAAATA
ncbi:hypothetical protein IP88_13535 [alpha proteobacterium AAP81b]|nr:hypothetical protein IP88_13535 [alpha proteobacterium AAP81b]